MGDQSKVGSETHPLIGGDFQISYDYSWKFTWKQSWLSHKIRAEKSKKKQTKVILE